MRRRPTGVAAAVLLLLLLLLAAGCDLLADGPAPTPAQDAAERPPGNFLELRVSELPYMRYLRVEASGDVEYVRHSWYDIRVFRAGRIPAEALERVFERVRAAGVAQLAEAYPEAGDGPPAIDPVDARLEVRLDGETKVVVYRLSRAPANLNRLHHELLTTAHEFPDNPRVGDYLRAYRFDPEEGVMPEGIEVRRLDREPAEAHAALRGAIRQPGRLVWAGAAGACAERPWCEPSMDNRGFFVEAEGGIHRILVLEHVLEGGRDGR